MVKTWQWRQQFRTKESASIGYKVYPVQHTRQEGREEKWMLQLTSIHT